MSVLVGKTAPDFTATAVMPDGSFEENFNLKEYLDGDMGMLFFWPLDFTFVCPSEIIAFDNRMEEFAKRGVKVIGATAHYVTADLDEGPIIEQDTIRVSHRDAISDLIRRGRDLEKVVLARAVRFHINKQILIHGGRTLVFD